MGFSISVEMRRWGLISGWTISYGSSKGWSEQKRTDDICFLSYGPINTSRHILLRWRPIKQLLGNDNVCGGETWYLEPYDELLNHTVPIFLWRFTFPILQVPTSVATKMLYCSFNNEAASRSWRESGSRPLSWIRVWPERLWPKNSSESFCMLADAFVSGRPTLKMSSSEEKEGSLGGGRSESPQRWGLFNNCLSNVLLSDSEWTLADGETVSPLWPRWHGLCPNETAAGDTLSFHV